VTRSSIQNWLPATSLRGSRRGPDRPSSRTAGGARVAFIGPARYAARSRSAVPQLSRAYRHVPRPDPLDHAWIVEFECRALRTDSGQLGEVVPRRRAAGRPLQRVAVAPRVVDRDRLAVAPALEHVPHERDGPNAEDERADRGHDVQGGEAVGGQIVGVAARHALLTQPVLHKESGVEADEGQPEVQLAQPLVEQPACHLREPEVDARVGREDDGAEQHVMEVRHRNRCL
jgi:hypothetical protein